MFHNTVCRITVRRTGLLHKVGCESLQRVLLHLKILLIATFLVATELGCVRVYKVEFQNNLPFSLRIVAQQFHATGFGSVRDREFPDTNLVRSEQFNVTSKSKIVRKFNDASGGFWVLWSAVSPENTEIHCSGEVDFTEEQSSFVVILDEKTCFPTTK